MTSLIEKELVSFQADLTRNRLFLVVEGRIKNPASTRSRSRSETLLSAYVTLSCGRFENFLKRSFRAAASEAAKRVSDAKDARLGSKFYWNNLNGFISWAAKAKNVERSDLESSIEQFAANIANGSIFPASFESTNANPNCETIRSMFSRFGVVNPMQKLSLNYVDELSRALPKELIESKINRFVKRRNEAAHEGRIAGATRIDIQDDHVFIAGLGVAIKRVLEEHVSTL